MKALVALCAALITWVTVITVRPVPRTVQPVFVPKPAVVKQYGTTITKQQLLNETNLWRVGNNLEPLTTDPKLETSAKAKCDDMQAQNYWSHYRPDGSEPWVFFNNAGYKYQRAGENLARNIDTAHGVTIAWELSPTHNKNLLGNFNQVGYAVCYGQVGTVIVQHLGLSY